MKLAALFKDAFRALFQHHVTEQYPFERRLAPERLRGALKWNPELCTGCALCSKDCPSNAIELIVIDRVKKQFVLRYHADRCTFCAQCVQNCRFKCIEMSNDQWELAARSKAPFTVYYGDTADVSALMEKLAQPGDSVAPTS